MKKYPYAESHLGIWSEQPPLRAWQKRFVENWKLLCDPFGGGQKDYLMAVSPAAGKTTACLNAAFVGFLLGWFGRIVVVVPSRNLVTQWIKAASVKGIALQEVEDYGTGISRPSDSGGIVTTYQTVAANPERFRTYSSREPTLVIGDEIHHCGEQEHLAWGEGMRVAFVHDMTMRLVSSGTPFRTDKAQIPFVRYEERSVERTDGVVESQRIARADFSYGYGDALRDGVVRDIFFPTWDSTLSWRRSGEEFTHTFQDDLTSQLASDRLKTALDLRGEWLKEVIKNANDRLMTIRSEEGHANAGGLIICKDQEHADGVAKIVEQVTGMKPKVAHADIPEASAVIDAFKADDTPWIVTVKMVSEGVDISRLRVGIYATNYKTQLFFLQAISRTTRYDSSVPGLDRKGLPVGQPAWFYVPDDPDLQNYMAQIMEMNVHHITEGLDLTEEGELGEITPEGQLTFLDGYEFIDGTEAVETGHYYDERKWTPEEMSRAERWFEGINVFDTVPSAAKAEVVERIISQQIPSEIKRVETREPISEPVPTSATPVYQDERKKLKIACSKMTRRLTYLLMTINQPPKNSIGKPIYDYGKATAAITLRLNNRYGIKNIGDCDIEMLKDRRALLANWTNSIIKGEWDPSVLEATGG